MTGGRTGGWAAGRGPEELLGPGRPSGDAVELLTGTSGEETSASVTGSGAPPTRAMVVGGVLAVVVLLVLLSRSGSWESTAEEAAPPTSVVPTTTPFPTVQTTVPIELDGPLLWERSDLTLFLGGDQPLTAIDLDSGEVTPYGVAAHPVLVTGEDLVLYQEAAGIVGWVPLDDPGQQAMAWKRGRVAPGTEPGRLWVLDPEADEPHPAGDDVEVGFGRWELFDTTTNRRVFRMPGDLYADIERFIEATPMVGGSVEALRPGPWYSTRRDGVYRVLDSGFLRVTGGRVLAIDDEAVLVEQCTIDGFCDLAWVGVETGEAYDRLLPEVRPRVARLVGGGTWLHSVGWAGTSELLELATGRRLEHDWATARPTVSPNGRWLAHWAGPAPDSGSDATLVLSDLATTGRPRPMATIDALDHLAGGSLLFAPAPTTRGVGGAAHS